MARPLTPLGSLGGTIAAALDEATADRAKAIEQARRGFLARSLDVGAGRGRRRYALLGGSGLAAAMAAAALWLLGRPPRPLEFRVDGAVGEVQTWLAAPPSSPLLVRFSEGTVFRIEPSSRARVVETDRRGASLALENGAIHAEVVHTPESAWRLVAGPFTVRVTGTRFDVRWDAVAERFSLSVTEGSVAVAGSVVGSERPVRSGETLQASVPERRLEVVASDGAVPPLTTSAETPQPSLEPAPPAVGAEAASPLPRAKPSKTSGAASAAAPRSWREFAREGDLRGAFSAAEAAGFEHACDAADAAELLVLGDAARLAARPDRASEALLALRRRYPGDPRQPAAAFALGKVAFDQRRAYAEAARWFATCVREQPNGPLTREASGRLLEALRSAGDAAGAERAARDYLGRYPDGPHATLARSLLRR